MLARIAAVVIACAAAVALLYALSVTDAMALARGAQPAGTAEWWWMSLPLWGFAVAAACTRLGGAAFLIALATASLELYAVVSALHDPRAAAHPVWLYESVGFGSMLLWPVLLVVVLLALYERRGRRAILASRPSP